MPDYRLIIIAVAILLILGAAIIIYGRRRTKTKQGTNSYISALHFILDGRQSDALRQLKKTVLEDTDNIMAYILLGDLFRETGNAIRAAKVHQNLLIRSDITDAERIIIMNRIVLDYRTAGQYRKAIEMAERLTQRSKRKAEYGKLLLSLYEAKGDWDKAFFYRQSVNKWLKKDDQSILALYKVQAGLRSVEGGTEREGRIRFREAIKLDKTCVPAYLYWGDSYRREGRNEDATRIWKDLCVKVPRWAHLSFQRLKEVLFDLGRYGELEKIYQKIIDHDPQHADTTIHLAELYRKQGNLDAAVDLASKILETHPDSSRARYLLVQVLQQKGNEKSALTEALTGLKEQMNKTFSYTCSECGFESQEPLWHCPGCKAWNSFLEST